MANKINAWIEAVRLRTIPVSIAGVLTSIGYAVYDDRFYWLPCFACYLPYWHK